MSDAIAAFVAETAILQAPKIPKRIIHVIDLSPDDVDELHHFAAVVHGMVVCDTCGEEMRR